MLPGFFSLHNCSCPVDNCPGHDPSGHCACKPNSQALCRAPPGHSGRLAGCGRCACAVPWGCTAGGAFAGAPVPARGTSSRGAVRSSADPDYAAAVF